MFGSRPTGLGIYAAGLIGITEKFNSKLISSDRSIVEPEYLIESPKSIELGSGRLAPVLRQLWLRGLKFDPTDLVYAPTHHAVNHHNQIITIHDLISLRFPSQHYSQYLYFKYRIPEILKRCIAVFTVSETTRHDISTAYNYPIDKIHVVPNSIDRRAFSASKALDTDPYLLMVGARYSHKNVDEVLSLADLWRSRYKLIVTSCGGKYRKHLENRVSALNLSDRVFFLDYLDRQALIGLYKGSAALVYPSKWEGFGIPPLESLACGRPVIVSDIPAHREVLGNSAFFIKPGNKESWKNALVSIEDDEAVLEKLSVGETRLSTYTNENAILALETSLLRAAPDLERRSNKSEADKI